MSGIIKPRLILASSSPRRQELIGFLGLPVEVIPSRYEEPAPPTTPIDLPGFVAELALHKAREVAQRSLPALNDGAVVIGADTLVSPDDLAVGVPLGKPVDVEDAHRMLRTLSGRTHRVYTGIAVLTSGDLYPSRNSEAYNSEAYNSKAYEGIAPVLSSHTRAVHTRVTFRPLTEQQINAYVSTGEPMDKAGAYGAQGYASPFIERIEGDFFTVVGLPLCELARLLEELGVI